ncbi:MAG: hypothetical protein ACFFG0_40315 [Candidatus Thorarchaeota archaeon]
MELEIVIKGGFGEGKTYTLKKIKEVLEWSGWEVSIESEIIEPKSERLYAKLKSKGFNIT